MDLMKKITYSEIAILLVALDTKNQQDVEWMNEVINSLDNQVITMHQHPEHGPILRDAGRTDELDYTRLDRVSFSFRLSTFCTNSCATKCSRTNQSSQKLFGNPFMIIFRICASYLMQMVESLSILKYLKCSVNFWQLHRLP
jgi:hypothetical protein